MTWSLVENVPVRSQLNGNCLLPGVKWESSCGLHLHVHLGVVKALTLNVELKCL